MARATFLADTSAFARVSQPAVAAVFAPLIAQGRVAVCAPVVFELGYSARNLADHDAILSRLAAFETAPTTNGDHQRAIELQQQLAARGQHRALSLVDALVAAIAEARHLIVLHYDSDFELVADITGQAHQWIVERGSAD